MLGQVIYAIQNQGLLGVIVYVAYMAVSNVIIFLPAVPLWPFALLAYGFWGAFALTLGGILLGSYISFSIARRYGRSVVMRILGKKLFNNLEHLTHINDPKIFFVIRLLGNFDTISYIAGLSKLKTKTYLIITASISFVWIFLLFFIMNQSPLHDLGSFLSLAIWYVVIVLIGAGLWELYHRLHLKKITKKYKK